MTKGTVQSPNLSTSVTVERYRILEEQGDRETLAHFIVERFEERYFKPIGDSPSKHGFAILAVCCLVIETLESFYQGRADTKGVSRRMFRAFFQRDTSLTVFNSSDDWFFENIRCGILHQSETRGGWRVWQRGPLLDTKAKTINASRFLRELRKAVLAYSTQLTINDECWSQFKNKMKAVCANST